MVDIGTGKRFGLRDTLRAVLAWLIGGLLPFCLWRLSQHIRPAAPILPDPSNPPRNMYDMLWPLIWGIVLTWLIAFGFVLALLSPYIRSYWWRGLAAGLGMPLCLYIFSWNPWTGWSSDLMDFAPYIAACTLSGVIYAAIMTATRKV